MPDSISPFDIPLTDKSFFNIVYFLLIPLRPCVANLLAGDSFGEKSLITASLRNATVITREMTKMFILEKKHYDVIAQLGNVR